MLRSAEATNPSRRLSAPRGSHLLTEHSMSTPHHQHGANVLNSTGKALPVWHFHSWKL